MKFTLTYDGALTANADPKKKWEIRKQFHPQLEQLWKIHPALIAVERLRYVDLDSGYMKWETHHSRDHLLPKGQPSANCIDLCEPVTRGGKTFLPIVRERLALGCGLKIIVLRQERPGKIYQSGDLDNRLKTLLDALSVPPDENQVVKTDTIDEPLYCLLEDDGLITNLTVETHRLLSNPNASPNEVRLIIEVDVRVTQSRLYNQPFLGD